MNLDAGQIVEILENASLYTTDKKDFLNKKEELLWLSKKPKYTLYDGVLLAGHSGTEQFRIGQRKKLGISGKEKPLYILAIDEKEQRIFVGQGRSHPGLLTKVLKTENTISPEENPTQLPIVVHFIPKNESKEATLHLYPDAMFIEFNEPHNLYESETLELYFNHKLLTTLHLNK